MNYSRLALAALGGTVAAFAFGFLLLWLVPALVDESRKYPAVFRPKEKIMAVMPIGMAATFIAILAVAIIFAMIHPGGSGAMEGARFGLLIGIFVVCAFVLHNYVNLKYICCCSDVVLAWRRGLLRFRFSRKPFSHLVVFRRSRRIQWVHQ
jgi:hypothetical protein